MYFLVAAVLAGALFLLIVFVFVPFGTNRQPANECGPQAPRRAYSWNLLGSFLAGVLFFFL
jgi:hypothetical protein